MPMAADRADLRDIQAALAGDGDAYGRLVGRYQNDIAHRMWRFTRDRGELEELIGRQEPSRVKAALGAIG